MKKYILFSIVVLLFSCNIQRRIIVNNNQNFKVSIDLKSENGSVHLNGMSFINSDSSFFNIFGPIGINLAKIKIKGDSLKFIDLQNKVIYSGYYLNLSNIVANIFFNHVADNEKVFLYNLNVLIEKINNKSPVKFLEHHYNVQYNFSGYKKRKIEILSKNDKINYMLKIIYYHDDKKFNFLQLDKYKNFKIITVTL